jgi:hypothetical protein
MPALDFPSSPANGQVYEQYTYDSTKGAWRVTANPGATVVSSPTAPISPVSGNLWLNTNDGVLFVYYNDGDTSQWVEVKSNTASGSTVAARVDALEAMPSGLIALKPTSVTISSGSSSVNALGEITITNCSSITINNVFSSQYRNYRMIFSRATSSISAEWLFARLVSAGTPNSAAAYDTQGMGVNTGTASPFKTQYSNETQYRFCTLGNILSSWNIEIHSPFTGIYTTIISNGGYMNSGSFEFVNLGGIHEVNASYDGIQLNSSGTFSGTISFYGYND